MKFVQIINTFSFHSQWTNLEFKFLSYIYISKWYLVKKTQQTLNLLKIVRKLVGSVPTEVLH